jgi:hypothetical protein
MSEFRPDVLTDKEIDEGLDDVENLELKKWFS